MSTPALVPTIHLRGQAAQLDRVFDLVRFVTNHQPLSACLDELPRRLAEVFSADVCSIYILEGEDLVMRANVGFPAAALGEVRLAIGQGITGVAVECMRPISVNLAPQHTSYHHVDGLEEERFPVFLALPILGPRGPVGALVLQRRAQAAFGDTTIELAVALTAPIAAVLERARLVDALRAQHRALPPGRRRVTLSGRTVVRGRAFGRAWALRRPEPARAPGSNPVAASESAALALDRAVAQLRRALTAEGERASKRGLETAVFGPLHSILDDTRLRERILAGCDGRSSLAHALLTAGSEAARAATRAGEDFALERAHTINDLCETLVALVSDASLTETPPGAVLVGDRLTIYDLLISGRRQPSALVLGDAVQEATTATLAQLIGVPTVTGVNDLFRWISDGETLLVDADHGLVRVSPTRLDIAAVRQQRRQDGLGRRPA
ncbi:MAG: GAF domain-containing protein [Proteobacteria bacterium]|nr:GAF domain-containing protein [Pseudomonadota bacterium]